MKQPTNKGQRSWFPLLVFSLVVVVAVLLIASRPRPEPLAPKERAWLVGVETIRLGRASPHTVLYGRLESRWSARLTAAVAAEVREVPVLEGDAVSRGDLLVQLDPRDAELRLAQREAEVEDAQARLAAEQTRFETDQKSLRRERRLLQLMQAEVDRLQDLVRKQVGAQSALDNARQAVERQAVGVAAREQAIADHPARRAQLEAALEKAMAARDQARLNLERCTITAPFDGRIARVEVAPGRHVRVGDPLVTVYDTGHMLLRALIPDRYLERVRHALAAGTAPTVSGRLDGTPIEGRLFRLAGEVDAGSGGVMGLFTVEAEPELLQQGRFVRLEMTLPAEEGVASLPNEAIYGADRIYRVDEQSRMRPLRVERLGEVKGPDGQTRLLVRSPDLRDGMRIVTTQLPNAVDGLLVRIAGASGE